MLDFRKFAWLFNSLVKTLCFVRQKKDDMSSFEYGFLAEADGFGRCYSAEVALNVKLYFCRRLTEQFMRNKMENYL